MRNGGCVPSSQPTSTGPSDVEARVSYPLALFITHIKSRGPDKNPGSYPAECRYKRSEAVVGLKTREEPVDHPDEPTDYDNQHQPHAP